MSTQAIRRAVLAILGLAFGLALGAPEAAQAQISVVVGPSTSQTPSQAQIAEMFTGARTTWGDGTKVQIVDQPTTAVGQQFYDNFLKQSAVDVRKTFIELVLSGQAAKPERVSSDAEVKAAVASTPGAIGFIQASSLDASVKEVLRIN